MNIPTPKYATDIDLNDVRLLASAFFPLVRVPCAELLRGFLLLLKSEVLSLVDFSLGKSEPLLILLPAYFSLDFLVFPSTSNNHQYMIPSIDCQSCI